MHSIVKFGTERTKELAALNHLLIQDEGNSSSMSLAELEKRMFKWLSFEYCSYGIEHNDRILCYSLWRADSDCYYMRQLYTDRDFRRQGLASSLIASLENSVYADKSIGLDVLVANHAAREFYESIGFVLYSQRMIKKL